MQPSLTDNGQYQESGLFLFETKLWYKVRFGSISHMSHYHITKWGISWTSQLPERRKFLIYQLPSPKYFVVAKPIGMRHSPRCTALSGPASTLQFLATYPRRMRKNSLLMKSILCAESSPQVKRVEKMPEAPGWRSYSFPKSGTSF